MLSVPLIDLMWQVPYLEQHFPLESRWFQFAVCRPLIVAAVLVFGPLEDLAAKRKPQLP